MAIADQDPAGLIRNRILWFGGRAGRAGPAEFKNRDLILDQRNLTALRDQDLIGVTGVVYSIDNIERTAVREHLLANLERIDDHGVATLLLAPEDSDSIHLQGAIRNAGLTELAHVRTGPITKTPDHEIAQLFVRHNPRMGWSGDLKIDKPEKLEISAADELLLRRAFSDSKSIRLEPLSGGMTAEAFRVHAQFEKDSLLVQPLPYFAKLGQRSKIDLELWNYRKFADFYVPFHLRPNIDSDRTVLGSKRGCLVGNFVEFAKPLWIAVEDGDFSPSLNALFDNTLRGWWAQAFSNSKGAVKGSVAGALGKGIFDDAEVRQLHLGRARALGLARSPTEIYEALCDRGEEESFFQAPFHGDLHPDNIFVRNADAILIDLGSARMGPIGGDPACLEVALAMDVRRSDLETDEGEWTKDVDRLFAAEAFERAPLPVDAEAPWKHRVNSIRKVRTLAQAAQTCETGYQSAIAMYLLRRAMYDASEFENMPLDDRQKLKQFDAGRRAYALVLAERLVFGNSGTGNGTTAGTKNPLPRNGRKSAPGRHAARAGRR